MKIENEDKHTPPSDKTGDKSISSIKTLLLNKERRLTSTKRRLK